MIPVLPAGQIRAAIAAEAWDLASDLLQAHDDAVVAALSGIDFAAQPRAPWQDLLAAQRALVAELLAARDDVGRRIDKLGHDQRGARAWLKALG